MPSVTNERLSLFSNQYCDALGHGIKRSEQRETIQSETFAIRTDSLLLNPNNDQFMSRLYWYKASRIDVNVSYRLKTITDAYRIVFTPLIYICVYVYKYVFMCVYIHMCVYIYLYIYIYMCVYVLSCYITIKPNHTLTLQQLPLPLIT